MHGPDVVAPCAGDVVAVAEQGAGAAGARAAAEHVVGADGVVAGVDQHAQSYRARRARVRREEALTRHVALGADDDPHQLTAPRQPTYREMQCLRAPAPCEHTQPMAGIASM